jgi:hypothetical protein
MSSNETGSAFATGSGGCASGGGQVDRLDAHIAMERAARADNECERKVYTQPIRIELSSSAAECLRCLFFHGPTWDGNVPSKQGRDELVRMGLAHRGEGWQWLTTVGVQAAFGAGVHVEKEKREAELQHRRNRVHAFARAVLGEAPTARGFDPNGEG